MHVVTRPAFGRRIRDYQISEERNPHLPQIQGRRTSHLLPSDRFPPAFEGCVDMLRMYDIGSGHVRWVTCGRQVTHAKTPHPSFGIRPGGPDLGSTRASNSASHERLSDHLRLANTRNPHVGIDHRQFRMLGVHSLLQFGCSSEPMSITSASTRQRPHKATLD